ncbi:hypothetical protein [Saccharothrix luteola]|uniref:hypothetical protein n=1 Tax=Saccharothrix luteola TaxID=2893018 RepID=UPI001E5F8175|nr:hypothetical protein [Saccharothrix luteola]MCC8246418.1 hypothetical protein [Saccharothrix luteola]
MTNHLTELLALDDADRRTWLLTRQPDDESQRANWWLALVEPLGTRVTDPEDDDPAAVLRWARLAATTLDLARETGALDAREVANRTAWLSLATARIADRTDVPPLLEPDTVARRSLATIALDRDAAASLAESWQDRPRDDIRTLRAAKNVLGPLGQLVGHLRDDELRAEVRAWLELAPRLP